MNRNTLRLAELVTLGVLAIAMLCLAGYMVHLNRMGEAFGAVIATLPLVIRAIGSVGQAQAMQSMADYLARSSPIAKAHERPEESE